MAVLGNTLRVLLSRSSTWIDYAGWGFYLSVTKVFTALLLCDMAEKGEVKLEDPVSNYPPDLWKIKIYFSK